MLGNLDVGALKGELECEWVMGGHHLMLSGTFRCSSRGFVGYCLDGFWAGVEIARHGELNYWDAGKYWPNTFRSNAWEVTRSNSLDRDFNDNGQYCIWVGGVE